MIDADIIRSEPQPKTLGLENNKSPITRALLVSQGIYIESMSLCLYLVKMKINLNKNKTKKFQSDYPN